MSDNVENLKEHCVQLYLDNKNYSDISKITGYSRKYITDLIKNDVRIIEKQKIKTIKVHKRKDRKGLYIPIPVKFIKKIGINDNLEINEYVDITVNNNDNSIVIKKHNQN